MPYLTVEEEEEAAEVAASILVQQCRMYYLCIDDASWFVNIEDVVCCSAVAVSIKYPVTTTHLFVAPTLDVSHVRSYEAVCAASVLCFVVQKNTLVYKEREGFVFIRN